MAITLDKILKVGDILGSDSWEVLFTNIPDSEDITTLNQTFILPPLFPPNRQSDAEPGLIVSGSFTETVDLKVMRFAQDYQHCGLNMLVKIYDKTGTEVFNCVLYATLKQAYFSELVGYKSEAQVVTIDFELSHWHYAVLTPTAN